MPVHRPEAQGALPTHEDFQEQFAVIAKGLHQEERAVFVAATERYGLAETQVGEKAIGEMSHQIRGSEGSSAMMAGVAYTNFDTLLNRKSDSLWAARDEVIDELLAELVPSEDSTETALFIAAEIGKSADAYINDRIASLKDESTKLLDTKVDALLPHEPDAQDLETISSIGKSNFNSKIQDKLDELGEVVAGIMPKHIGQHLLRKLTGEGTPEKPATESEIYTALRDFEVTIDQVRNRDGVNATVRDSIREYLAANGLAYPTKTDYQRVVNEVLDETDYMFDHGATKEDLKSYLQQTTVTMLREMGYVKAGTPKVEAVSSDNLEADPAILQEIDEKIAEMRAQGIDDRKIYRKLVKAYHPDTSGLPRAHFQYFESYFND